jgi:hypothetical protein
LVIGDPEHGLDAEQEIAQRAAADTGHGRRQDESDQVHFFFGRLYGTARGEHGDTNIIQYRDELVHMHPCLPATTGRR